MDVNTGDIADLEIEGIGPGTQIGRGGFGTVYRAEQVAMGREVAVKVLPGIEASEQHRFEQECRATGLLSDHPHIVSVYGAGTTTSGRPWLAMQLCAGSMADRLATDGPLEWPEAVAATIKLAGALETAHRAGILHRDLKPANILVTTHGEPALADFGIARARGASETTSSSITGTVEHTAPEVLSGRKAGPGSDVYSLASTLFALISGSPPFRRDGDEGLAPLMMRVVSEGPPDLRPEGLPGDVADVLERGLAKDPKERFATAEDFGAALQSAEAALGIPLTAMQVHGDAQEWEPADDADETATRHRVRPVAAPLREPEPKPKRRRPIGLIAAAVSLVVLLVAGLVLLGSGGGGDGPPDTTQPPQADDSEVQLDHGVIRARGTGLDVHRVWTLSGEDGTDFTSEVTLTNSTEAVVAAHDEVIPKELAASVIDIVFEPAFSEIIEADPIVRYRLELPPGGTFAFTYRITVEDEGLSKARLERWRRALDVAQNAYDKVDPAEPPVIIEEPEDPDDGRGGETSTTAQKLSPTTTKRTTTTLSPPPPPPPSATKPGAPSAFVVNNPEITRRDDRNEVTHVRVDLGWSPPGDDGGEAPSGYRIRCTIMKENSPSPESGSECDGKTTWSTSGSARSTSIEVVRPYGALTWVKWEIAAINSAGVGTYRTGSTNAPVLTGLYSWDAWPLGRTVGLMVGGATTDCGQEQHRVCTQSVAAGQTVSNGTSITLAVQP